MKNVVCLSVLFAAAFGIAWAGDYEAGLEAYKRNDYDLALSLWKPLSESGDTTAQTSIAYMYMNGIGVAKDDLEATRILKMIQSNPNAPAEMKQQADGYMDRIAKGADPTRACMETIPGNEKYGRLSGKVVIGEEKVQPAKILANNKTPSAKEKALISLWTEDRKRCVQLGSNWRSTNLPSSLLVVLDSYFSDFHNLTADLSAGKVTYGKFAKNRVALNTAFDRSWQSAISVIRRQIESHTQ